MKRPCFALTLLLVSLAGSLLAVSSAKCQTGLDPAPSGAWNGEACPLAPSESSGSLGLGHDEDARWQAHQAEENLEYSRNHDAPVPADVTTPEPAPAQVEAPEAQVEAPAATEPAPAYENNYDYNYRSDYDTGYDHEVYRPETAEAPSEAAPVVPSEVTPVESGATEELDPYWTENTTPSTATDELDPYWTQEVEVPSAAASEGASDASNDSTSELDPYWTNNDEPATTEQPAEPEAAQVDPQWAKDAVESVEEWIEKLNAIEVAPQPEAEVPAAPVEPQADTAIEKPAGDSNPTYGAHLWDDCEYGSKSRRHCEYPLSDKSNYGAEPAPVQETVVSPAEQRELLLNVARSLNDVGIAFQAASQNLVRIVNEADVEQAPMQNGTEEYAD